MSVDGDDDSNPMHAFGHGRGDDAHKPRRTAAYSFVDPQRIVNVGDSRMEPTQPMEAVESMSVKDIVHRLVERNLQAWKALPEKIRDRMLERPQDFQLIPDKTAKSGDFDWQILYNGTVWRFHNTAIVWTIADVLR